MKITRKKKKLNHFDDIKKMLTPLGKMGGNGMEGMSI